MCLSGVGVGVVGWEWSGSGGVGARTKDDKHTLNNLCVCL